MPVDATPMGANSNAYCTRSYAVTYLTNNRLGAKEFLAAATTDQDKAIIMAASIMDGAWNWQGAPRTFTQAMQWPRYGVQNRDKNWFDADTVPDIVQQVNADLAALLMVRDRTLEPEILGLGMKEIGAGGGVYVIVDPQQVLPLIPSWLSIKLDFVGELKPGADDKQGAFLKVLRT
jgi:hypothetical protein